MKIKKKKKTSQQAFKAGVQKFGKEFIEETPNLEFSPIKGHIKVTDGEENYYIEGTEKEVVGNLEDVYFKLSLAQE